MRRIWIVVAVILVAGFLAACGEEDKAGASSFTFLGFSDHTGAANSSPADVVKSGGTLKSCNPSSLYAFVSFRDLKPPKEFAGVWTLDEAPLNQQKFTQTEASAQTFWQVQNTPKPLSAGAYRFVLSVEGKKVSEGKFTLTC